MRLALLVVVFVTFSAWSFGVLGSEGVTGVLGLLRDEPWGRQLFVDLTISLLVAWAWLRDDARARGIPAWPYFVGTLATGSIAVLAYLIHREIALRRERAR